MLTGPVFSSYAKLDRQDCVVVLVIIREKAKIANASPTPAAALNKPTSKTAFRTKPTIMPTVTVARKATSAIAPIALLVTSESSSNALPFRLWLELRIPGVYPAVLHLFLAYHIQLTVTNYFLNVPKSYKHPKN